MSTYGTFHIAVTVDHEYTWQEEDVALRRIEWVLKDALKNLRAMLPDGWEARESDGQ